MNKCDRCGRYYIYDRKKGHRVTMCNSCMVNRRRIGLKEKAIKYKGSECRKCGYNRCLTALEFHHLDPKAKDFQISGAHSRSWAAIKKELDKCVMLCANCHRELGHGDWKLEDIIMKKKLKHKKHNNGP